MIDYFAAGVKFEEDGDNAAAERAYTKLLMHDPGNAAALINLGTICYNAGRLPEAIRYYRGAIQIDPKYALAHFDYANVLDETNQVEDAIKHYTFAIRINPLYADAHYNLALAFEKIKQPRRAMLCWRKYIKMDISGPWHDHAKRRFEHLMRFEPLRVVWQNDNPKRTKRRGRLTAC